MKEGERGRGEGEEAEAEWGREGGRERMSAVSSSVTTIQLSAFSSSSVDLDSDDDGSGDIDEGIDWVTSPPTPRPVSSPPRRVSTSSILSFPAFLTSSKNSSSSMMSMM